MHECIRIINKKYILNIRILKKEHKTYKKSIVNIKNKLNQMYLNI